MFRARKRRRYIFIKKYSFTFVYIVQRFFLEGLLYTERKIFFQSMTRQTVFPDNSPLHCGYSLLTLIKDTLHYIHPHRYVCPTRCWLLAVVRNIRAHPVPQWENIEHFLVFRQYNKFCWFRWTNESVLRAQYDRPADCYDLFVVTRRRTPAVPVWMRLKDHSRCLVKRTRPIANRPIDWRYLS